MVEFLFPRLLQLPRDAPELQNRMAGVGLLATRFSASIDVEMYSTPQTHKGYQLSFCVFFYRL